MIRDARGRLAAALLLALPIASAAARSDDPPAVTHGPILGRPGARQMGVWARTERPGAFVVRYGTAPDRLDLESPPVPTAAADDCTGRVVLEGLEPDTLYHYRVDGLGDDGRSALGPGGTFRTWPDPAALRDPERNPDGLFNVRFQVGSCANQGEHSIGPSLPVYDTLNAEFADAVQFAIMNGDWSYEERRDEPVAAWLAEVGLTPEQAPPLVRLAPTIAGIWANDRLYLERGRNMAAWHRRVPSFFTIDDHEILNDVVGCGEVGYRDRRAVFRDIALAGWYDYVGWANPTSDDMPIRFGSARLEAGSDLLVDPSADFRGLDPSAVATLHVHWGTPTAGVDDAALDDPALGDPNAGVYEVVEVLGLDRLRIRPPARADGEASYSIGRRSYYRWRASNCEFFALDTRTHRTLHDAEDPKRPGPTMIGEDQRRWLMDGMAASDADFLFVISSVPFTIPHNGAGGMNFARSDKDDSWTSFLHERERLIAFFETLGRPVFVLTGDLHNSFAVRVSDRIWEFCAGPHNSANHPASSEGGRPPNGPFDSSGRPVDIRWSTYIPDDVPTDQRRYPAFLVVQVNNVFDRPRRLGGTRRIAYPRPQAVFRYHDGRTGDLLYAEAVQAAR